MCCNYRAVRQYHISALFLYYSHDNQVVLGARGVERPLWLHPTMADLWFVRSESRNVGRTGRIEREGNPSCPIIWAGCIFISRPCVETFDVPGVN